MKLSPRLRLVPICAVVAVVSLTGCTQFGRGYRQEKETLRYSGESLKRSTANETEAGALMKRSFQEDIAPWGFWDSLSRGWKADLDYWEK